MENLWSNFQQTLALEIGKDLAEEFVNPLLRESNGDIAEAIKLYHKVGNDWASVIIHWRNWIKSKAIGQPVLVMRDAKPLSVVPIANSWPKVWLNRNCCGIPDELSGESEVEIDQLVEEYMQQQQLNKYFTFVDSGCWGTIVKELHCLMGMNFQPLFFFSHNPSIPGFLNELGFGGKDGEILNDSFECCFPNTVMRPSHFVRERDYIAPQLQATDNFSVSLGEAALNGIKIGVENMNGSSKSAKKSVEHLLVLAAQAKNGKFTGILPRNSPTWSRGSSFLSDWPRELCWT